MNDGSSSGSAAVLMGRRGSTSYVIDGRGLLKVAYSVPTLLGLLALGGIAVVLLGAGLALIAGLVVLLIFRRIENTTRATLRENREARSGSFLRLFSMKEISWAELQSISVKGRKIVIKGNDRAKYRFSLNQSELEAAIELFRSKLGARVMITSNTASTATSSRSLRLRPAVWGVGLFTSGIVLFLVGGSLIVGIPLDSVPIWDGVIINVGALFVAASMPIALIGELVRRRRSRQGFS
jgi:hypothetical protein